jgi:hypothetical protein
MCKYLVIANLHKKSASKPLFLITSRQLCWFFAAPRHRIKEPERNSKLVNPRVASQQLAANHVDDLLSTLHPEYGFLIWRQIAADAISFPIAMAAAASECNNVSHTLRSKTIPRVIYTFGAREKRALIW